MVVLLLWVHLACVVILLCFSLSCISMCIYIGGLCIHKCMCIICRWRVCMHRCVFVCANASLMIQSIWRFWRKINQGIRPTMSYDIELLFLIRQFCEEENLQKTVHMWVLVFHFWIPASNFALWFNNKFALWFLTSTILKKFCFFLKKKKNCIGLSRRLVFSLTWNILKSW